MFGLAAKVVLFPVLQMGSVFLKTYISGVCGSNHQVTIMRKSLRKFNYEILLRMSHKTPN